jgi:hypothetical protein
MREDDDYRRICRVCGRRFSPSQMVIEVTLRLSLDEDWTHTCDWFSLLDLMPTESVETVKRTVIL